MTIAQELKTKFDDIVKDEDGVWSQVCLDCTAKLKIPDSQLSKGEGHGICGVEGCNEESEHYINF